MKSELHCDYDPSRASCIVLPHETYCKYPAPDVYHIFTGYFCTGMKYNTTLCPVKPPKFLCLFSKVPGYPPETSMTVVTNLSSFQEHVQRDCLKQTPSIRSKRSDLILGITTSDSGSPSRALKFNYIRIRLRHLSVQKRKKKGKFFPL